MNEVNTNTRLNVRASLRSIKHKANRKLSFLVSSARLHKLDRFKVPNAPGELRLFVMARNESLRLPYFLEYYFSKGVDRVFLIDNDSTDETVDIALAHDNVHVFQTKESFKNYSNWMEILLDKYGSGHWCISADSDEILCYPYRESLSIKQLCHFMERQGDTAMQCLLLDMYSDKPVHCNEYAPGSDPLSVCTFFDPKFEESEREWINMRTRKHFLNKKYTGNMRKRVFGASVSLSKVPLFKYGPGVFAVRGMHGMDGVQFSAIRGVVLHFKYLQDFNMRVVDEAARGQHEGNAADYKQYAQKVEEDPDLNCYYEGSVKFEDSMQLIKLGLIKTPKEFDAYSQQN